MTEHPSSLLKREWIDIIRNNAAEAEKNRCLHPDQLQLIYNQQWFKILVPAVYGGLELSLPEVVALEEAIAWADGSMGWTVTLCAGAGWFGGFMQKSLAENIFSVPHVCLAGSGATTGIAEKTKDGYKINGQWLHASGAPNATVFTANCLIMQNGSQLHDETGKPQILSFAFMKEEVSLIDTWNSMGMTATASNSYKVKDLELPSDRTFILGSKYKILNSALYRYPFIPLAELTLAANISGIAIHFIDLAKELFDKKTGRDGKAISHNIQVAATLEQINSCMLEARKAMFEALENSWKFCVKDQPIPNTLLLTLSNSAHKLASIATQSVDKLYPFCGLIAADIRTEINRCYRDLHTAGQHSLLVFGAA